MKSFIVLTALVAVVYGAAKPQFQGQYQPQPQYTSTNQDAQIVRQEQDINPDGSYKYSYETSNGIAAQEQGYLKDVGPNNEGTQVAQGSFSYTAPDGSPISVSYVSDENGFRAEGAHIPTPPPIPEAILRAIQYIQSNPAPQTQPAYQPQQQKPFSQGFRG